MESRRFTLPLREDGFHHGGGCIYLNQEGKLGTRKHKGRSWKASCAADVQDGDMGLCWSRDVKGELSRLKLAINHRKKLAKPRKHWRSLMVLEVGQSLTAWTFFRSICMTLR